MASSIEFFVPGSGSPDHSGSGGLDRRNAID
jgi:hypothetical protein